MAELKEKEQQSGAERETRTIALIQKVSKFNWFENVGEEKGRLEAEQALKAFITQNELGIEKIEWISRGEFVASYADAQISNTGLYEFIGKSYQTIVNEAQEKGNGTDVAKAVDAVTDSVFHATFDKAFELFSESSEELVKYVVELTVYIALMAYAQEAKGLSGENSFAQLAAVLEQGHLPVNIADGTIYVL
ncbi:hypothetical protein CN689_27975 [Peribacillus butanolivorans]|uniref:Uncharacterized protein n=1 Tax=Peribacillus butanolivorans TaxID=421767 RepID=A0AAX0RQ73_9BACI|nr:hypothetical protein [Peribacillus butanolivorans]AXN40841.1 hypothetical protein DTO10_22340 [Peribacillus butanolivorans]PEJ23540.1 hypothetical protein CN689_27975 [Peribacillus butanolivorans]